jgi:hypothetical protein
MALSWPHPGPNTTTVGSTTDLHAADRPPFSFTIAAITVDGYEFRPDEVFTTPPTQFAVVLDARSGDGVADLVVSAPTKEGLEVTGADGSWPFATVGPHETSAQVNGLPAVVSLATRLSSVRWKYAPDAWAVLQTTPTPGHDQLDAQTLLRIAADVRFVDPYPIRVPFRLDYLPTDLQPFSLSVTPDNVVVQSYGADRTIGINVTDATPRWPGYETWQWTPATIAGLPARCSDTPDPPQCELTFGDVRILVGGLTPAERDQVVAGLHLATFGDPSTWFDVVGAIPGA